MQIGLKRNLAAVGLFLVLAAAGYLLGRARLAHPDVDQQLEQLKQRALRAFARRDYSEVVRILEQVPKDHPFRAEALTIVGKALTNLNFWQRAEWCWKQALELDPRAPEAGYQLLQLYFVLHRWSESRQLALRLVENEPDPHDRALYLLELIRQEHERLMPTATVQLLEPVLALEPDYYHAKRALGLCYVQIGRVSEGLKLLYESVEQEPEKVEGWASLCWCLSQVGRWNELDHVWQSMSERAKMEPEVFRYRGHWAEAQGQLKLAASIYKRVLEKNPYDRKTHYRLARLLHRLGDEQAAIKHEQRAKQLDNLREALGNAYKEAVAHPGKLSADECRQLAKLCRDTGRLQEAARWELEANLRAGHHIPQPGHKHGS